MRINFRVKQQFREGVLNVPDELDHWNTECIDEISDIVCDTVTESGLVEITWKFEDEPDSVLSYRTVEIPTWKYMQEIIEKMERLEKEVKSLKTQLTLSQT